MDIHEYHTEIMRMLKQSKETNTSLARDFALKSLTGKKEERADNEQYALIWNARAEALATTIETIDAFYNRNN